MKDESWTVFLYKPEFSAKILTEGLVHAVGRLKRVLAECDMVAEIADQYPAKIDFEFWLRKFDIEQPANLCLGEEIESDDYEVEIRAVDVESEPNLRRTIAAVAILAKRLKQQSDDLAREVARKGQKNIE